MPLTNGPLSYWAALPSRDGKRIFAIGTKRRGELVRYDIASKRFLPFLSGMSAIDPTFSADGKWVAYTSYPDHTLWRSRIDGTDRLQLTYPPIEVAYPFISPDGKQIAYYGDDSSSTAGIFVVGMEGGTTRKILDKSPVLCTWSPDGNSLVCTVWIPGKHVGEKNVYQLERVDLQSGERSVIPSSQGIIGAFWITQDTLIASNEDSSKFLTFSFRSGMWTELLSGSFVNWALSLDGKYFYYTTAAAEAKAMRLRFADHKIEEIASLKDLRRVTDPIDQNTQISVAPDGSPVFTRDIGTQEIYALTVKWP
jgi:Tol biopolymer transport system component